MRCLFNVARFEDIFTFPNILNQKIREKETNKSYSALKRHCFYLMAQLNDIFANLAIILKQLSTRVQ